MRTVGNFLDSERNGKSIECLSLAMISGTVSRAWNSTFVGSLSGAIIPLFKKLDYSPKEYLATALSFTVVTHVVDYYLPIHGLFASAVGLFVTAKLGFKASTDVIVLSMMGTAVSGGLHLLNEFSSLPIAVAQAAAPVMKALGFLGSVLFGELVATVLYCGDEGFSKLRVRQLVAGVTLSALSCSYLYDTLGNGPFLSHLTNLRNLSGLAAIVTYIGHWAFSRGHH